MISNPFFDRLFSRLCLFVSVTSYSSGKPISPSRTAWVLRYKTPAFDFQERNLYTNLLFIANLRRTQWPHF